MSKIYTLTSCLQYQGQDSDFLSVKIGPCFILTEQCNSQLQVLNSYNDFNNFTEIWEEALHLN